MSKIDWVGADWGTSHLRVFAMSRDGCVLDKAESAKGMGRLDRDGFEPALLELIDSWLGDNRMPIIACGMVGAKQGWKEAPYAAVPSKPIAQNLTQVETIDGRLDMRIAPGLQQDKPADVMRGEETQIAGFLALNKDYDGIICLPGTHSKWAHISADEVISFRSFMTGEMFDLLAQNSVLRHSIGEGWDEEEFAEALSEAISRPESVAGRLFAIRAESLLSDLSGDKARARLSGFLIGLELAASRPYWLGQNVALIGSAGLVEIYNKALSLQGVSAIRARGDEMVLAGLTALYSATFTEQ